MSVNILNNGARLSTTPSRPRYGAPIMARARVHRDAGWSYDRIRNLLHDEFGVRPSRETVIYWTNDAYRQRKMVKERAQHNRNAVRSFKLSASSREYQAAFVRRLREEGEPVSGVVRVCRVVFGGRWTRGRVVRLLGEGS